MSETTEALKKDVERTLDHMRTLRDEIRVKLHLANMDAKDEWEKLQPKLEEAERAAEDFTEASYAAVEDAVKKLTKLGSRIV